MAVVLLGLDGAELFFSEHLEKLCEDQTRV